jgi:light-regulated signal transduction histidine kinase (bacteriophytochrome)
MKIDIKTIGLLTHDLKGPVGNISMFTQLLTGSIEEAKDELGESYDFSATLWQANYIQTIAQKFIDQLQNWSDLVFLSENAIVYTSESIDIISLAERVFKENEFFWAKKQLNVNKEFEEDLVCEADHDSIRRCLDNLFQLLVLLSVNRATIGFTITSLGLDDEIRVCFKGLKNQDVVLFSNLYLNAFSNEDSDAFSKGVIKTTGAGLAFCGMAIRYFGGSPFAIETETGLEFGFTIKKVSFA